MCSEAGSPRQPGSGRVSILPGLQSKGSRRGCPTCGRLTVGRTRRTLRGPPSTRVRPHSQGHSCSCVTQTLTGQTQGKPRSRRKNGRFPMSSPLGVTEGSARAGDHRVLPNLTEALRAHAGVGGQQPSQSEGIQQERHTERQGRVGSAAALRLRHGPRSTLPTPRQVDTHVHTRRCLQTHIATCAHTRTRAHTEIHADARVHAPTETQRHPQSHVCTQTRMHRDPHRDTGVCT